MKRLSDFHSKQSQKILEMELKYMEYVPYNKVPDLELPQGLSLIKDNRQLYAEGKEMGHCVYGRHSQIFYGQQIIIRSDLPLMRATISLVKGSPRQVGVDENQMPIMDKGWVIGEIRGKHNDRDASSYFVTGRNDTIIKLLAPVIDSLNNIPEGVSKLVHGLKYMLPEPNNAQYMGLNRNHYPQMMPVDYMQGLEINQTAEAHRQMVEEQIMREMRQRHAPRWIDENGNLVQPREEIPF
jgi:hypothetical protein